MTIKLNDIKKLRIFGTLEFEGQNREVEVVKMDKQNNVMGFKITIFGGKKVYVGASKHNPKLSDLKNIRIELPEQEK